MNFRRLSIKFYIRSIIFVHQILSYDRAKLKVGGFYVLTRLIFAGLVTYSTNEDASENVYLIQSSRISGVKEVSTSFLIQQ